MIAEQRLKEGNLEEALDQLQQQVRQDPSNPKYRIFLFQLLSVLGQWERALTQLNVVGDLDDGALAMVIMYRQALACELFREQVFQGDKTPLIFGDPEEWVALLIQALNLTVQGRHSEADDLRARALEQAATTSGVLDGEEFAWIADSDSRLGPVLEAIIDGRYFWVPFQRIHRVDIEQPADLRDAVWLPAHFEWGNGGESYGLIPTRYPASFRHADPLVSLARKTEWEECAPDTFLGYGQRILVTDANEYPLMDVRTIEMPTADEASGE